MLLYNMCAKFRVDQKRKSASKRTQTPHFSQVKLKNVSTKQFTHILPTIYFADESKFRFRSIESVPAIGPRNATAISADYSWTFPKSWPGFGSDIPPSSDHSRSRVFSIIRGRSRRRFHVQMVIRNEWRV